MPKLLTSLLALVVAFAACAAPQTAEAKRANVVQTAVAAGQFKTLIAAAQAAGLAGTLATTQGITVFAPTDAAFARLGQKTIADLLKPRNRHKLRAILLYHVVGKRIPSRAIAVGRTHVKTLNGKTVTVRRILGVRVNDARVVTPDVDASNGVIHVIDRVLLP